jgi:hypothetical protein
MSEPKKIFHTNVFSCDNSDDWHQYTKTLMDSNGGVHNDSCKIKSKCCSKEMSADVSDLCAWHRIRMARHVVLSCGCKEWNLCSGDSVGRGITMIVGRCLWLIVLATYIVVVLVRVVTRRHMNVERCWLVRAVLRCILVVLSWIRSDWFLCLWHDSWLVLCLWHDSWLWVDSELISFVPLAW